MIVARFALAMKPVVISGFTLATSDTGVTAAVIPELAMVPTTSIVAALTLAAPRHQSTIAIDSTSRTHDTAPAIHPAGADALTHGSDTHASAAPAHPHAGRTPTIGFAGAAKKQR